MSSSFSSPRSVDTEDDILLPSRKRRRLTRNHILLLDNDEDDDKDSIMVNKGRKRRRRRVTACTQSPSEISSVSVSDDDNKSFHHSHHNHNHNHNTDNDSDNNNSNNNSNINININRNRNRNRNRNNNERKSPERPLNNSMSFHSLDDFLVYPSSISRKSLRNIWNVEYKIKDWIFRLCDIDEDYAMREAMLDMFVNEDPTFHFEVNHRHNSKNSMKMKMGYVWHSDWKVVSGILFYVHNSDEYVIIDYLCTQHAFAHAKLGQALVLLVQRCLQVNVEKEHTLLTCVRLDMHQVSTRAKNNQVPEREEIINFWSQKPLHFEMMSLYECQNEFKGMIDTWCYNSCIETDNNKEIFWLKWKEDTNEEEKNDDDDGNNNEDNEDEEKEEEEEKKTKEQELNSYLLRLFVNLEENSPIYINVENNSYPLINNDMNINTIDYHHDSSPTRRSSNRLRNKAYTVSKYPKNPRGKHNKLNNETDHADYFNTTDKTNSALNHYRIDTSWAGNRRRSMRGCWNVCYRFDNWTLTMCDINGDHQRKQEMKTLMSQSLYSRVVKMSLNQRSEVSIKMGFICNPDGVMQSAALIYIDLFRKQVVIDMLATHESARGLGLASMLVFAIQHLMAAHEDGGYKLFVCAAVAALGFWKKPQFEMRELSQHININKHHPDCVTLEWVGRSHTSGKLLLHAFRTFSTILANREKKSRPRRSHRS